MVGSASVVSVCLVVTALLLRVAGTTSSVLGSGVFAADLDDFVPFFFVGRGRVNVWTGGVVWIGEDSTDSCSRGRVTVLLTMFDT